MYRLLTACFFILCSLQAHTQTKGQVDSLLRQLDSEKEDSVKMNLLRQIGSYYTDNNVGKAIVYLEGSLELAKKLKRNLLIANNYYSLGFCYLLKNDFDRSLENYLLSVRVYEEMKDSLRLSNAFISIGNLYSQNHNFKKTTEYYDKARMLIEAKRDSSHLATLLNQVGTFFDQQKQYDSALTYLQHAGSISLAVQDDYGVVVALSNLGLTYKHQGNTEKALQCFDSVLNLFKKFKPALDDLGSVYNNIGATHAQAGNYAKAQEAFNKSIDYSKQAGSIGVEMENYRNLAEMFGSMKNYEQQATYLQKYYSIKDSLFNADTKNQLTELESDYKLEKKNTEIAKKEAEVIKQRDQRNIFIIITLAAVLLLSATVFFYRRIKKANGLLQEKNVQIQQQKNELETLNHVKDRLFSIISHDLRNPLVTLRSYLQLADSPALDESKKQSFRNQATQAVVQTSDMLDNLLVWANMQIRNTPVSIVPVNIAEAVQDILATVQAQAAQKQVNIHHDIQVNSLAGDAGILSIALRNLVTNAIKYSNRESTVQVNAYQKENRVYISVKDEGVGMTAEQLDHLRSGNAVSTKGTGDEKGSGLGIFLVRELLEKIDGTLQVESVVGKGSEFTINLPAL